MAEIKICEMSKSAVNPTDSDLFVMDRKTSSGTPTLYTTNSFDGEQLKGYIFSGNNDRVVTFGTVKSSIDARTNSGGVIQSVLVRTLANDDNSENAASTKWVGTFWSRQLTSDNTVAGTWSYTGNLKLPNKAADMVAIIDANRNVSSSIVSRTKLEYIANLTGDISDLLNKKADKNNPTFTGTITTPLSADKVVITDSNKRLIASEIKSTELSQLSGIYTTKTIQAQLNDKASTEDVNKKADKNNPTFTGTVKIGSSATLSETTENGLSISKATFADGTTAVTQPSTDSSTKIATTEWVSNKLNDIQTEEWIFTLQDGVTKYRKKVVVKN